MTTPKQHTAMGELWNSIQTWLLPVLEDEIGELDAKHRQFVAVCELCAPHNHMVAYRWLGNGCPPKDRLALCKAFIAKAVWDFATTSDLIDAIRHRPTLRRLCGWETLGEVPSESTFSRAFEAFARDWPASTDPRSAAENALRRQARRPRQPGRHRHSCA